MNPPIRIRGSEDLPVVEYKNRRTAMRASRQIQIPKSILEFKDREGGGAYRY